MKKRGQITAFYIETLVMIVVMIGILLVLTQILGLSKRESVQARRLTEAVTIAQTAAEALAAEADLAEAAGIMGLENVTVTEEGGNTLCSGDYSWIRTERTKSSRGETEKQRTTVYRVDISRSPEGDLTEDVIRVYASDREDPVYTLTVRNRIPEEKEEAA